MSHIQIRLGDYYPNNNKNMKSNINLSLNLLNQIHHF